MSTAKLDGAAAVCCGVVAKIFDELRRANERFNKSCSSHAHSVTRVDTAATFARTASAAAAAAASAAATSGARLSSHNVPCQNGPHCGVTNGVRAWICIAHNR